MANVESWWTRLSPSVKRNLAVGGIGTVLLAVIIALATVTSEVSKPLSKQATIQHILTDSDPRSLGIDGISAQLRDLLQKNDEQARRLAAIEEQQRREQQSDEIRFKQWTTAEREAYEAKLQAVTGEVESLKNKASTPAVAGSPGDSSQPSIEPTTQEDPTTAAQTTRHSTTGKTISTACSSKPPFPRRHLAIPVSREDEPIAKHRRRCRFVSSRKALTKPMVKTKTLPQALTEAARTAIMPKATSSSRPAVF